MKKFLFLLLLCSASCFAAPVYNSSKKLLTGTYMLSGGNSKWSGGAYQGEVYIQPQGENYSVVWQMGTNRTDVGIGILYNDILSVAFANGATGRWGVVSFRLVADGELEGRWTMSDGRDQKPEYLVWKGY